MQIEADPTILEIDRSDTWVRARQDEDGNFQNDEVKKIAEDIVSHLFISLSEKEAPRNYLCYILLKYVFCVVFIL